MLLFGKRALWVSIGIIVLWMLFMGLFLYRSSLQFMDNNNNDELLNPKSPEVETEYCKSKGQKLSLGFWQRINLHKKKIPQSIKESSSVTAVESGFVIVHGSKVHYIHAKPKELDNTVPVLLLHGQSFTSETWNELGTIKILAALGYYPIAIDLPGFGKTPGIPDLNKSNFIHDLITSLNIKRPVLISPSMSGSFSLKYLTDHPMDLGGYVPVSPVQTNILNDASCKDQDGNIEVSLNDDCQRIMHYLKSDNLKLNCIKVPSLVVWGERDRGENSAKLCLLPESQGAEIPNGEHPAYLSNPERWHQLLYNFISAVNDSRACM